MPIHFILSFCSGNLFCFFHSFLHANCICWIVHFDRITRWSFWLQLISCTFCFSFYLYAILIFMYETMLDVWMCASLFVGLFCFVLMVIAYFRLSFLLWLCWCICDCCIYTVLMLLLLLLLMWWLWALICFMMLRLSIVNRIMMNLYRHYRDSYFHWL